LVLNRWWIKLTVLEKPPHIPKKDGWVWTSCFSDAPDPELRQKSPHQKCDEDEVTYFFNVASSCYYHGLPLKVFVDEKHLKPKKRLNEKGFHIETSERNIKSAKDQSFFSYLKAISQLNDDDLLLVVDCSNVLIKRDPFPFLSNAPGLVLGEDINAPPAMAQNKPLVEKFKLLAANKMLSPRDIDTVNRGFLVNGDVIAGRACHIKICLELVCSYLTAWQSLSETLYMPAINLVANQIDLPVWVGEPFSSIFQSSKSS
jgi:hypothetical protein